MDFLTGYIRNHDDEVSETPDESKMDQYEAETKRIWFEMYGTPLAIAGNYNQIKIFSN